MEGEMIREEIQEKLDRLDSLAEELKKQQKEIAESLELVSSLKKKLEETINKE